MKLEIYNFRSIRSQSLELAPITVVYGPNGAGKSSLLYALLTLKNVIVNPNQTSDAFFNYMFMNLGGFEAVVFDHQTRTQVGFGVTLERDDRLLHYLVSIGVSNGGFRLTATGKDSKPSSLELKVPFPYPANQQTEQVFPWHGKEIKVTWNGITAQSQVTSQDEQAEGTELAASLNTAAETLRGVTIVPLKRGFAKPYYSAVPVSPVLITEDEVATSLSSDKYLISKVSHYLEAILGRDFRVNAKPGTAIFSLDATDKRTGVGAELVNEGFGVNQTVHLLARCLHKDSEWVCIEEPEIHLHPTAVRALAAAFVRMVQKEKKRFVISTHSESLVVAFLALVAKSELNPSDFACYLAKKDAMETNFERQIVKENGQIEGGLASFIEAELADVRDFMQVTR